MPRVRVPERGRVRVRGRVRGSGGGRGLLAVVSADRRVRHELRQMGHQRGEPPDHPGEPTVQPERQRPGDLAPETAFADALQQERHDLGETHGHVVTI